MFNSHFIERFFYLRCSSTQTWQETCNPGVKKNVTERLPTFAPGRFAVGKLMAVRRLFPLQRQMARTVASSLWLLGAALLWTQAAPLFAIKLFPNAVRGRHYVTFFVLLRSNGWSKGKTMVLFILPSLIGNENWWGNEIWNLGKKSDSFSLIKLGWNLLRGHPIGPPYTYLGVLDLLLSILAELRLRAASRFLGGCLLIPLAVLPPSWAAGCYAPGPGRSGSFGRLKTRVVFTGAPPLHPSLSPVKYDHLYLTSSLLSGLFLFLASPLIKDSCLTVAFTWLLSLLILLPFYL